MHLIVLGDDLEVKNGKPSPDIFLAAAKRFEALEKSKYKQSLATVRHYIAICDKELELYYRHIALYGDPNDRNPMSTFESQQRTIKRSYQPLGCKKKDVLEISSFQRLMMILRWITYEESGSGARKRLVMRSVLRT